MPDFDRKEANVKLNAAAILREGQLLKKKEDEEARVMKAFEMNLRDETEFNRWFAEMKERDQVELIEHMQKKKIEMELAREEAIAAREANLRQNQILVKHMKEISELNEVDHQE